MTKYFRRSTGEEIDQAEAFRLLDDFCDDVAELNDADQEVDSSIPCSSCATADAEYDGMCQCMSLLDFCPRYENGY